jgi:serine phosphatase RsbU (regulator of sigma subunit)
VLEDAVEPAPFRLEAGEWVVLFSDGLTELADPSGRMLGLKPVVDRLGELCSGGDCTAEELAQRLSDWLDGYRGTAPAGDDRTFLIARRLPDGAGR